MSGQVVRVIAPSRLHFGMLSLGEPQPNAAERGDAPFAARRFGGLGAMIASPGLHVTLQPAERFECAGLLTERVREITRRLASGDGQPRCRIEVTCAPRLHVGLGTGTQLAMAVVAGLNALAGGAPLNPVELARRVGRGERSAIGLYGFVHGGLLLEAGKTDKEDISPLLGLAALPEAWRFVLICPKDAQGLSGEDERQAFAALPPVPPERTEQLYRIAQETLLPAAVAGQFDAFSESLYRFGYLAGLSFAPMQGGPFAGPRLTELVEWLRGQGIRGVGQSSWGPSLFALVANAPCADDLVARLQRRPDSRQLDVWISTPCNGGTRVERCRNPSELA